MVQGKQKKVGILLNFTVSSLTQASLMINKTYVYGVQKRISMSYQFPLIKQNNPTQNIRINVEFILIIPIHSYLIIPYTNTSLINYSNTPRKFCFLLPTCTLHKSRRQHQTLGLMVHRLSAHFLAQWPLLQQNVQLEKKHNVSAR